MIESKSNSHWFVEAWECFKKGSLPQETIKWNLVAITNSSFGTVKTRAIMETGIISCDWYDYVMHSFVLNLFEIM